MVEGAAGWWRWGWAVVVVVVVVVVVDGLEEDDLDRVGLCLRTGGRVSARRRRFCDALNAAAATLVGRRPGGGGVIAGACACVCRCLCWFLAVVRADGCGRGRGCGCCRCCWARRLSRYF